MEDIKKELKFMGQCIIRLTTAVKEMNKRCDITMEEIRAFTEPRKNTEKEKDYRKGTVYKWKSWPKTEHPEMPKLDLDTMEYEAQRMMGQAVVTATQHAYNLIKEEKDASDRDS